MYTHTNRTHSLRPSTTRNPSIKGFVAQILTLQSIWRERRALNAMSQQQLDDIGQSRGNAKAEARRPAWDAPNRWLL